MTAYKYVARDEESRVNWGDISKKWSDAIITGEETREKKRQDIQTATDELTDSIINAPMGENEGVNAWYSNFADQSSEYLLDANRRLKSGDLKVRDYNTIMANMTQGTERMTGLAKDYSDNYAIKMERLQNDKSQQAEVAMMELAEGYANFTNTQGIVNPTNGMISIAKNGTGETVTIPQMRAYINMQYDKYDVGAALDEQVARLAANKKVIMSGNVKTRESQLQAWNLAKDNLLDAELADGLHVSSILTEDVGGYNVVTDATKVGENDVLFVLDPSQPSAGYRVPLYGLDLSNMTEADLDMIFSADLDDAQRSALIKQAEEQKVTARDWLNTDFERRLGVLETPMAETTGTDSDTARKARERAKREARMVTNWDVLGTGIPEDQTVAAEAIVGMLNEGKKANERILDRIVPDADGQRVTFFYPDGTSRNVSLVDEEGNRLSRSQWLSEGTEFHGVEGDYGRFYEGGIVPAGSTVLERGERTVGYEEPAVGYNTETKGFDPATGKLIQVTPRSSYVASTEANSSSKSETSAALGALSSMNFSDPQVSVVNLDPDGLGNQTDAVMYFVPGLMPYQVFVPEDGGAAVVGRLNELVSEAREQKKEVTIEQLKAAIGMNNYDLYNTQDFRDANPVEVEQVENPDATPEVEQVENPDATPEVDAFGNPI